ncbi:hypothetical protein GCWU000342_01743 [Shuttleworthella satelles DSM 14600]|uniref:Uncharacterized protein n=1 Tax=Shuttleworthella satelles DSM 14600 TaxID=626523 RepID=C4GCP9_9FIRM|nr:hypothetical protein GCWU000342_01743 [Shuttleworthia satelles DSM 14600]
MDQERTGSKKRDQRDRGGRRLLPLFSYGRVLTVEADPAADSLEAGLKAGMNPCHRASDF